MSDNPQEQANQEEQRRWKMSRRQFLIGLGSGAGLLAVGAILGGPTIVREARLAINQVFLTGDAPSTEPPTNPSIWVEIDADNVAHLYIPKMEMGQGVHTSIAQIAADELELDWDTVVVHQPDTAHGFDPALLFTFGSTSITALYQPTREIAANMREMLREEASNQLGVASTDISCENSFCFVTNDPDTRLSYGEVVATRQAEWLIPETQATLKTADNYRYIGQPVKRVDFREKVTGRAVYGFDARTENMLYGAIARPPRYGATLSSASAGDAENQAGVVAVVIEDGFAGIVAQTRPQAYAALEFLDLEWEGGITWNQSDLEDFITIKDDDAGILIQRDGNVANALNSGTVITAEYRTPMAAHAHLEPQAGLADIQGDTATIYASTQAPDMTQNTVAERLGLEPANVLVIPNYLGGGFGRKTGADAPVEAAILAKAVGRPVHVGWNRTEEMQHGYRRPPTHHQLSASIDSEGNLIAMEHQLASGDVLFGNGTGGILETVLGADPLAAYGALINYGAPNRRVIFHRRKMDIPTGFWRGLGSFPNTFAVEAFIDEVADTANTDPLQFRLDNLPDSDLGERMRVALETVASESEWDNLASDTVGRGIALTYDRGTVVALVMTIRIENNRIKPLQAWCAVDPGLVINPDGAAAQVQGQVIMALSSSLYEKITIENGLVINENFNSYPLLTMRDTPSVDVYTINSSDTPVGGLGEPVVGTVPAAMSNAIFNLTGQRLRELPFKLA